MPTSSSLKLKWFRFGSTTNCSCNTLTGYKRPAINCSCDMLTGSK